MASGVKLYVYRINDREYGAGLGLEGCERQGSIVEEWPLNTRDEAKFLATHGTSYYGATDKVSRIADLVYELMTEDSTFQPPATAQRIQMKPEPIQPAPKPGLIQRIRSWYFGP